SAGRRRIARSGAPPGDVRCIARGKRRASLTRVKLPRIDEVEHPPIGARRGVTLLALLVDLLSLADHLRRHGLAHERLVDPVRAAVGADKRGAVDPAEVCVIQMSCSLASRT